MLRGYCWAFIIMLIACIYNADDLYEKLHHSSTKCCLTSCPHSIQHTQPCLKGKVNGVSTSGYTDLGRKIPLKVMGAPPFFIETGPDHLC